MLAIQHPGKTPPSAISRWRRYALGMSMRSVRACVIVC